MSRLIKAAVGVVCQGQISEWALLRRHRSEDLFGVQICGSFPDTMCRCAELLNQHINIDFIDINVGCPIDLVFNKASPKTLILVSMLLVIDKWFM